LEFPGAVEVELLARRFAASRKVGSSRAAKREAAFSLKWLPKYRWWKASHASYRRFAEICPARFELHAQSGGERAAVSRNAGLTRLPASPNLAKRLDCGGFSTAFDEDDGNKSYFGVACPSH